MGGGMMREYEEKVMVGSSEEEEVGSGLAVGKGLKWFEVVGGWEG